MASPRKAEYFAGQLFDFIWKKLERGIPDQSQKYRLEKGQPSGYTPEIGEMVFKMQIDFRDDLQGLFSKHPSMRMDGSKFFEFVKQNLKLLKPTDVFDRTCASCAIFSEFALYHFKRGNKDYLEMAPKMWSNFFYQKLRGKFNSSGGWTEFQKRATTSAIAEGNLAEAPTPSGIERLQDPEASASIPSEVTKQADKSVPPSDATAGPSSEVLPVGLTNKIVTRSPEDEEEFAEGYENLTVWEYSYIKSLKCLEDVAKNPDTKDEDFKVLVKKFLKIDLDDEGEPTRSSPPVSEESVSATSTTLPSTSVTSEYQGAKPKSGSRKQETVMPAIREPLAESQLSSGTSEHQGVKPKSGSRKQKTAMPAIRDPRTESSLSKEDLRRQLLRYFANERRETLNVALDRTGARILSDTDTSKTRKTRKGSQHSKSSKKSGRR